MRSYSTSITGRHPFQSLLTIGNRFSPAGVRSRVIIHQVQVNLSHHAVQFSSLLPITVSWEQLIYDRLSTYQVITDKGEKSMSGCYWTYPCVLRAVVRMMHFSNPERNLQHWDGSYTAPSPKQSVNISAYIFRQTGSQFELTQHDTEKCSTLHLWFFFFHRRYGRCFWPAELQEGRLQQFGFVLLSYGLCSGWSLHGRNL